MSARLIRFVALVLVVAATTTACSRKKPPVARPTPPPPSAGAGAGATPPAPPAPLPEPEPPVASVPAEPAISGSNVDYNARSLDELNRESPLQPVFYSYDGAEVTPDMQATLQKNADILKQYPSWVVTIEGHCDERGTAEYNLTWRSPRAGGARLPDFAGDPGRTTENGVLREGVPLRPGRHRRGVCEEPPRAFRGHQQVSRC